MTGPQPRGHWTGRSKPDSWEMLHPGHIYRVTRSFRDFDGTDHPVGEQWTYLSFNFLPYDDGLSLFVSLDAEHEWHIRMQLRPEEQGAIMHNLPSYLAALDPIQPSASIAGPAVLHSSNRSTHLLLAASLLALVLGFVTLHLTDDGPGRVAPTSSALLGGLIGIAALALGALLGLIVVIKLVKLDSSHHKSASSSSRSN